MKREVIVHQDPKSPISEVFRTLRTNIQFMNTQGKLKTILVTSTLPGEGKSWVSSNLAVTFAQAGKKVVLIDADMRKGRQYSIFGVSPRPGLSNYLSGIGVNNEEGSTDLADFIQETDVDNLYIISAGNIPPNPAELLIAPQMVDLLDRLKDMCDIIIIDGPPSQLVTDALILTRLVDSTLIVAAYNETLIVTASKCTKKEDLKRVIANIQNVGGKIAGVIVNKVPMNSKKYEQSYYYGSTAMTKSRTKGASRPTPKRQNNEMYNRASNIMAQSNRANSNNKIEKNQNENISQNIEEMPKALQNNINIENKEEVSEQKTAEILNQINQYLDEEKNRTNE